MAGERLVAEIIFLDPAGLNPAIAELAEFDFDIEVLDDWIDDEGPAMWILATVFSELDASAFLDWVKTIINPLGGDVIEAGSVRLRAQARGQPGKTLN